MSESLHQDARDESAVTAQSTQSADREQVGTFSYLLDGGQWLWSQAAARIHGHRRADVQPSLRLLLQHTHFEDRTRMVAEFRRVSLGEVVQTRYRIFDSFGDLHQIVLIADQLKDGSGQVIGATGCFVDVTDAVRTGVTAVVSDIANSRSAIEQAKGVLIAAYGVSADDAFAILVRRSQDANVKVKDIARVLVEALSVGSAPLRRRVDDVLHTVGAQS